MSKRGEYFRKIKDKVNAILYTTVASLPLFAGEFTTLYGLKEGDTFYMTAGVVAMGAAAVNWARRISKNEFYNSLDSAFEYHPLPSITIPATIVSGLISLELFVSNFKP